MHRNEGWVESMLRPRSGYSQEQNLQTLAQTYGDIDGGFIANRDDLNIVDHYYYPDSDLETIQEESSVLDSEDERSVHRDFHRSSGSTGVSLQFGYDPDAAVRMSDSDRSHSSLSSSSTPRQQESISSDNSPKSKQSPVKNTDENVRTAQSPVDRQNNAQNYFTYNGEHRRGENNKVSRGVDPFAQQKIVYAKCLTNNKGESAISEILSIGSNIENGISGTITDMFELARAGNVSALESFSAGELCDTVDEKGNTTLHIAAEHGHLACVQKLVSMFSPQMVTLPNDDLMTPTAMAAKSGSLECVQWLVGHTSAREELTVSKRPSSIDGSNTRPPIAHVAARFDMNELLDWICEEMLSDGIAIDTADHCSNTPVHVAARYGHLRCIQTLVSRGASVTVLNSDGDTPGQAAQKHNHDTCVGYLVVVETCVSLAQQLVALRNDMDAIKSENEKLRNDLVAKCASLAKSELNAKCSNEKKNEDGKSDTKTNGFVEADKLTGTSVDDHYKSNVDKRRTLQEQPPPPKMWSSPRQDNKVNGKLMSSLRGHAVLPNSPNRKQPNPDKDSILQRRINAALKSPGASLGGDRTTLRVSDVDSPGPPPNVTPKFKSPTKVVTDVNTEVQSITKGIGSQAQRKPWEKLTMDEMLRMVRDIRYQPSPSISLCTEDSTMESVEVMKERMAAASRWFLVENTRDKSKHGNVPAIAGQHNGNVERNHKAAVASKPVANNYGDHLRPAVPRTRTSKPAPSINIQSAIQQQYNQNLSPNKVAEPKKEYSTRKSDRPKSGGKQAEVAPTGTLKFMVTHSKPSVYMNSPKNNANRNTSKKSSLSPKSLTSPQGTPPISPTSMSTQRNNSYRKAVQLLKKGANEMEVSTESLSSSSGSNNRSNSSDGQSASEISSSTRDNHKAFPADTTPMKSKKSHDPLQKRTGPGNTSPTYAQPMANNIVHNASSLAQRSPATYDGHKAVNSNAKGNSFTNPRPAVSQHKYFNTWSIPRNTTLAGYGGVNSYRHKYDEDGDVPEVSEVPELKTEIPSRQSSFLRKVQGKLK